MEEIGKLLDHLGYATPLLYAAAAYGLFHWLDENASDEAKAALARAMTPKNVGGEQVASALAEVFDNLYTRPLLGWPAFFRSMTFTFASTLIFLIEAGHLQGENFVWPILSGKMLKSGYYSLIFALLINVFTDYISLFVIRKWLLLYGARPVKALLSSLLIGVLIVGGGAVARSSLRLLVHDPEFDQVVHGITDDHVRFLLNVGTSILYTLPALAVFVWLPLFALGVIIIRLVSPLSWMTGRAQWFLKDGKEHPLKAVGCVAAVAVFSLVALWRMIINA